MPWGVLVVRMLVGGGELVGRAGGEDLGRDGGVLAGEDRSIGETGCTSLLPALRTAVTGSDM